MKKVFGICDLDKSYVEVLTRYIGRKEGQDFNVVGFSKVEALADFVMHEKFSVLLISVSFIEELSSIPAKEDVVPKDTFILTEDLEPGGYKFPEIYKYQSTEHILRQIEKSFSKKSSNSMGRIKTKSVVGVYSPIGRCGKTSFAMEKAREFSQSASTLLISFDRYPVNEIFEGTDSYEIGTEVANSNIGVSDLLYLSATEGLANFNEGHNLKHIDGLDVILKVQRSDDIYNICTEDAAKLIDGLKKCNYQKIVIDVGGDVRNPETVLEMCDEVYVPHIDDEYSVKKQKVWEEELERNGSALIGRIKKVNGWNC